MNHPKRTITWILCFICMLTALSTTFRLHAGRWTRQGGGWQNANTPAIVGTRVTTFLLFWLPDGVEQVRGVLVFADRGNSGAAMYHNGEIRALAKRTNLCVALLGVGEVPAPCREGCALRTSFNDETYSILKQLADSTLSDNSVPDHPEMEFAPLMTWGYSAAGNWAVHYASNAALADQLDRSIFWTRYHSNLRELGPDPVSPSLYEVPGLMIIGGADEVAGSEALDWHSLGRKNGAPWTVCIEPDVPHGGDAVWALSLIFEIPYFEAVVNRRLSEASGSGGDWAPLNVFPEAKGWLGLNDHDTERTFLIAPFDQYSFGPRDEATWLPTEEVALLWQATSKGSYYRVVSGVPSLTTGRPSCKISNLNDGDTVNTSVMVDVSATDSDGMIDRVYFLLDGQVVNKLTSPTHGSSYQHEFTDLSEGVHWLGARSYDDRGLWRHHFVRVTVLSAGLSLPGDCTQDGNLDISDGICLLGHLFLGNPEKLPCGDTTLADAANIDLLDSTGGGVIDLSDAISVFNFLFLGGPPPVLGKECVPIADCPIVCQP